MKRILIIAAVIFAMVACHDNLSDRIDDLDLKIAKLEKLCDQMNQDVTSVKMIVMAIQNNDYVTGVIPVMSNDIITGYTITFYKGEPITITNGKDGIDGKTPVIGAQLDKDGLYYWTLDGDWLLDSQGNKMPVRGENGITPKLKIEEGSWFVSYDEGETWQELGKISGEDYNSPFSSIEQTDNDLIIILKDGSQYVLPLFQKVEISFDFPDTTYIVPGKTLQIKYELTNATENTIVTASSDGYLITNVEKTDLSTGIIKVRCNENKPTGYINVVVSDNGYSFARVINFYEGEMEFPSGLDYFISAEGGTVIVPLLLNVNYTATVSEESTSWLSLTETKSSSDILSDSIKIYVASNNSDVSRIGKVFVYVNGISDPYREITILQEHQKNPSKPAEMIFKVRIFKKFDYTAYIPLQGDIDCTVDWGDGNINTYKNAAAPWVEHKYENITDPFKEFIVTISGKVTRLSSYAVPNFSIPVHSVTEVIQWGETGLKSLANAFMNNTLLTTIHEMGGEGFKELENIDEAFRNCSSLKDIPAGLFANCTNLTSLNSVFSNCSELESLPEDIFANCINVNFIRQTFEYTPLKVIPENLFNGCTKAIDFYETFSHCYSLTSIPENLFTNCPNVTNFYATFSNDVSLTSIPANLFNNCLKVDNFGSTFNSCAALTGESPYTEINGVKYHLYERNKLPDLFVNPHGTGCFHGCPKLTDYNDIPIDWK